MKNKARPLRFAQPLPPAGKKLPISVFNQLRPSQLLRLAVRDMDLAVKRGVVLDMGIWHHPGPGTCTACMAGCVLHQSLGRANCMQLIGLSEDTKSQLHAIDAMRLGYESMLVNFGVPQRALNLYSQTICKTLEMREGGEYAEGDSYLSAAKILEEAGF